MGNYNRDDRSKPRRDFSRRDSGNRGMHKAVCGKCGKDCEVPFEPRGDRPVLCRECFSREDSGFSAPRRPNFEKRPFSAARPAARNDDRIEEINQKLDKILSILTSKNS